MKTVLFFDRSELTRLYILITQSLKDNDCINVMHVAYSDWESRLLENAGISNYIHYKQLLAKKLAEVQVNDKLLKEIDDIIIQQSKGRFNMNGSIESDRCFKLLSYEDALRLASAHYLSWKEVFSNGHVDIVYHEPCSMFMTHILALLCKAQNGIYRYPVQSASDMNYYNYLNIDGEDYTCVELENRYRFFVQHPEEIDKDRCLNYLTKFRSEFNVFLGEMLSLKKPSTLRLYLSSFKRKLSQTFNNDKSDKLIDLIEIWRSKENISQKRLHNMNNYKKRHVYFETMLPKGEKYYYYSFHLEPEATVLYLGDGIYANQVKLIENIAASLPPGYYLYVKDHPHEYAYRDAEDYLRLMSIPNVRLIHQSYSGKQLISGCVGVFSINGTAGLEGLLLGKQVYCFGQSYYSFHPYVNYIHNVRDIRKFVYCNIGREYPTDDKLFAFVNAYLNSLHRGFITYFGNRAERSGINPVENANYIAQSLMNEFIC